MKPIIFLIGPSGVGKSYLLDMLAEKKFVKFQIDTDRKSRSFAANDFPSEWDRDFNKVKIPILVSECRDRLDKTQAGAVVSFPTTYIFTPEKLFEAKVHGVTSVVLWGKKGDCIRAAQKRIAKKGKKFKLPRYERLNGPTFLAYGNPKYDSFRVEAFQGDGSRYPNKKWLALIMGRMSG